MEYIALEVFNTTGGGSKFMNLPSDTSITITETSELFDTGDIWSFSFKINPHANANIFGTAGEIHGSRLHDQIDKRRARLWLMGLPVYLGYLKLDDEVDVDANGNVDISFESGRKTFHEMIDGIKANQVPIPDDILIGMALDRERTVVRRDAVIKVTKPSYFGGAYYRTGTANVSLEGIADMAQSLPKFVRPDGTWILKDTLEEFVVNNTVNTIYPYDKQHPYCNINICYQKKKWIDKGGSIEQQKLRQYHISKARRINPSPNFYFLYWLDCLMKHLNIRIEENGMLNTEDLLRLFFVNTKCAYTTKGGAYTGNYAPFGPNCPFVAYPVGDDDKSWNFDAKDVKYDYEQYIVNLESIGTAQMQSTWHKAYATSDNFPEKDISDIIDAVESGFGVRFIFNADYTKVRIVLLRDVLSSQEVHEVPCDVLEVTKRDNSIRGFRLTYGASEEDTNYYYQGFEEIRKKREGGWLTEDDGHDYNQWDLTKPYLDIVKEVSTLNNTCYVDPVTGNAYVTKIDENFKNASQEAYPSLFECAAYMDAEDGDCAGEDETIKTIRIGFTPMPSNIVSNGEYALFVNEEMGVPRDSSYGIDVSPQEIQNAMADSLIIDTLGRTKTKEEVKYQTGLFEIATATWVTAKQSGNEDITISGVIGGVSPVLYWNFTCHISGWIRDGYRLYLEDNYAFSDDMEVPLEKPDWGLMFGVMRGTTDGILGSKVTYTTDLIDAEGNDTWSVIDIGSGDAYSDSCNPYGGSFTYRIGSWLTDTEWGDVVLERIGWQNQCNLKTRKASARGLDSMSAYDTYFSASAGKNTLWVLPSTPANYSHLFYIHDAVITDTQNVAHNVKLCCVYNGKLQTYSTMFGANGYTDFLQSGNPGSVEDILSRDHIGNGILKDMILAIDPPADGNGNFLISEQTRTMLANMRISTDGGYYTLPSPYFELDEVTKAYLSDNATPTHYLSPENEEQNTPDRISLKLRAEKPNPFFDPTQPESKSNRRYLEITTPELRHRGLMDKFHKEESYWWRNAKIAATKCQMGFAELRSIDKTVRQHIGDVTGFVKKVQYTVNIQTGLSPVNLEVWYI